MIVTRILQSLQSHVLLGREHQDVHISPFLAKPLSHLQTSASFVAYLQGTENPWDIEGKAEV